MSKYKVKLNFVIEKDDNPEYYVGSHSWSGMSYEVMRAFEKVYENIMAQVSKWGDLKDEQKKQHAG